MWGIFLDYTNHFLPLVTWMRWPSKTQNLMLRYSGCARRRHCLYDIDCCWHTHVFLWSQTVKWALALYWVSAAQVSVYWSAQAFPMCNRNFHCAIKMHLESITSIFVKCYNKAYIKSWDIMQNPSLGCAYGLKSPFLFSSAHQLYQGGEVLKYL